MKDSRLVKAIQYPLTFIAMIWGVHILQLLPFLDFRHFGVKPRHVEGLYGILFSPLLHGDFGHLISNSVPLLALGGLIFFFYPRVAWRSLLMIYVMAGVALWLFGNMFTFENSYHIGASGVVYGMVAFVFWSGIFRKNLKAIVLALIVLMYYGGLFMGILPGQEGISWEGHLYGALVGMYVAYWYKDEIENDEKPTRYSWEDEPDVVNDFLPKDTFDKTKEQRRREAEGGNDGWFSNMS